MPDPIQAAAEVLWRQYESQYNADHLSWRDFADDAQAILDAVTAAGWSLVPAGEYGTLLDIAGTDTPNLPSAAQVRAYLWRTGWEKQPPGPSGSMWQIDGYSIGVADDESDRLVLAGTIRRVAAIEQRRPAVVIADMRKEDA